MLQNKNIWTRRNYSLCSSASTCFRNIPGFSYCWSRAFCRSPPTTIAVHHGHSLDINDKLPPSIAMTQRTIRNFQVARTDKNISARLRIEVSALLSHSCVNIHNGEAKESVLKPNCSHDQIVPLCPRPASPSRWCPKASLAFQRKQFPSSLCGGRMSNPRISRRKCPISTEENFELIIDNIFPKSAVGRNCRTLSIEIPDLVLGRLISHWDRWDILARKEVLACITFWTCCMIGLWSCIHCVMLSCRESCLMGLESRTYFEVEQ